MNKLETFTHGLLERIQRVINSPLWFFGWIVGTLAWMVLQPFLHIDSPRDFFPFTVLVYTLFSLWVENAFKAQQAIQHDLALRQEQMQQRQWDRIEQLVTEIKILAREELNVEAVLKAMIQTLGVTVEKLKEAVEAQHDR